MFSDMSDLFRQIAYGPLLEFGLVPSSADDALWRNSDSEKREHEFEQRMHAEKVASDAIRAELQRGAKKKPENWFELRRLPLYRSSAKL
jgi:hypothetical protein